MKKNSQSSFFVFLDLKCARSNCNNKFDTCPFESSKCKKKIKRLQKVCQLKQGSNLKGHRNKKTSKNFKNDKKEGKNNKFSFELRDEFFHVRSKNSERQNRICLSFFFHLNTELNLCHETCSAKNS
jgi:hypothetical protein